MISRMLFNTIQPNLIAKTQLEMNVHASTVIWILDYVTNALSVSLYSQNAVQS